MRSISMQTTSWVSDCRSLSALQFVQLCRSICRLSSPFTHTLSDSRSLNRKVIPLSLAGGVIFTEAQKAQVSWSQIQNPNSARAVSARSIISHCRHHLLLSKWFMGMLALVMVPLAVVMVRTYGVTLPSATRVEGRWWWWCGLFLSKGIGTKCGIHHTAPADNINRNKLILPHHQPDAHVFYDVRANFKTGRRFDDAWFRRPMEAETCRPPVS